MPHTNVPLAKRIQLSSKSDTSDLFPEDSPTMNVAVGSAMSPSNLFSGPNSLDTSNIVGTPAFITTLMMKYIKFSDEQRQAEEKQDSFWQSTFSPDNTISPICNNNGENSLLSSISEGANVRPSGLSCSTPKILSTKTGNFIESGGSNDDLEMNDDDECLLNNLPTSVDDLQDKEQQIKLERQINSPLRSHRQSPNGFEAGRISALSSGSHGMNGIQFTASVHAEEELDADDMEVAMINESFEEQQRQYKLYGEELKSVFYSAPVEVSVDLPSYPQPIAVPDNDEPLYNDEAIYRWREESSPQMQIGSDFLVDDAINNSLPNVGETERKLSFPPRSVGGDSSQMSSSCARQILLADDDASATAISSAKFVLGSLDSPYKTPSDIDEVPMIIDTKKEMVDSNYSSEDEELAQAWEGIERFGVSVDGIRYYIPRNVSPPITTIPENLVEPPKNIKALGHVIEIFEVDGELDSEPVLQYFKSIGMKNFYQRDIDIQRAFLVFATVDEAKFAVENNKTDVQMRLLEESPQFVKMKALKMHSELVPCSFEESVIKPTFSSVHPHVLESVAGV
uniref:Uncharacterized protein n=1 Tax=Panagrolaimus sp. JU765 TaxID=591449 RepID=A0AC34PUZ9_9BILA